MPAVSSLQPDDKATIKRTIPSTCKILTATVARVFYQQGSSWKYSGVQGGLCLVVDKQKGGVWFRVVDLLGTRGVIWEHELPISSTWSYNQDRGFFHSFPSEETNVAFVFADESEAGELYKKVQARGKYNKKAKAPAAASSSGSSRKKKGGRIDKSLISGPSEGSFKHIAHMGYTSEHGFSSKGVDPSWQALLDQLGNQGISQKQIIENEGFIRDFVQGQGGLPPPQPKKRAPPPAPTSKRKAPPPPPSRAATSAPSPAEVTPTTISAPPQPPRSAPHALPPPPPPPPPPARQAPPPTPSRPSPPPAPPRSAPSAPPLPPAMPPRGGPPPPPPPPPHAGGAPPPPPPPPPSMDLPPPQPGRANLLASIQGAGLGSLRKTDASDEAPAPPGPPPRGHAGAPAAAGAGTGLAMGGATAASEEASPGGGGGGDLAGALAAALNQRKGDMGNSDDEESEDEWD